MIDTPAEVDEDDDDEHDGDDSRRRLEALFAVADAAIAAGFDVLPAATWMQADGTLGKAPLLARGHLEAHRDNRLIRQQLVAPPHRPEKVPDEYEVVVAFVPGSGGHGVFDCDVKKGKVGLETLKALTVEHGAEFVTSAWRSPSGGVNVLLRKPIGATFSNRSPWDGVDVRADAGWVVAPGCRHSVGGAWVWLDQSGFATASPIPAAMAAMLRPAAPTTGRQASNAETIRFIKASPTESTFTVMQRFAVELATFRAAERGSRHGALMHIIAWSFGLRHLDLRTAMMQIDDAWQKLTTGERRESEPSEVATWVAGREIDQRAAQTPPPGCDPLTGELTGGLTGDDAAAADAPTDGDDAAAASDGYRLTDAGNALRLVAFAAGHLRYVHAWGRWIVYQGGRWQVDAGDALATDHAKRVARKILAAAATAANPDERKRLFAWGIRSESSGAIASMIRLARGDRRVLTTHDELDTDPYLLNVKNGTVDLRTGLLRPHDPADLLTLMAPVKFDPSALAPRWLACIERWQPDPLIREYLQREVGAGTTGFPTETLSIHHGGGGNGKSKFFGAVQSVLGPYAVVPHKSLLVTQRHEQHDTVKANLFRKRLAVASETKAVDELDAEQVKSITGGDVMDARRMREDPWEFRPTHTLAVITNFKPAIRGRDEAIWRRVRLIPWDVTIPKDEVDTDLAAKLRAESAGILLWMIEGARRFIADGIDPPASVQIATEQYRSDEDTAARFVAECLVLGRGFVMSIGIKQELDRWCRDKGIFPMQLQEITPLLTAAGCTTERRTVDGKKSTFWVGARIEGDVAFSSSEQP